jgi:hypothetical protein
MWKPWLVLGIGLLAVGETLIPGDLGTITQLGAVAVLAAVCWRLFALLKDISAQWNEWEKIRHTDHETLNNTLASLRENCAARAEQFKPHA